MTTLFLQATQDIGLVEAKRLFRSSAGHDAISATRPGVERPEPAATRFSSPSCKLELSKSRAHDAALEILDAYKLTGNFHINIKIVVKELGVLEKVTFEIEPRSTLSCPDRRYVVFRPNENIHVERFHEIMSSIRARIGFDAAAPWWVRLLCWLN
jgi:hypothetical protein